MLKQILVTKRRHWNFVPTATDNINVVTQKCLTLTKIVQILHILALTYVLCVYLSNLRNDNKLIVIATDLSKLIKTS